ncbi:hypothetical protein BU25DRAFT_387045 [Macroventuria anomochaeta]|uniref:Uncharacterized protein n=1 Tax=Macroventuria anomochaeta TaxID=301207 RepID=A0ACB6SBV8_9PLEO|nr:uncharacterized protein BU25DRAFT_387045 [Macroventuria anomochaeta]KAF2630833.1 hypothetical protein BU25DRAFT_387045 [Macroventuria anomochaeta]
MRQISACLKLKGLVEKVEPKHIRQVARHTYLPIADYEQFKQHDLLAGIQEEYDSRIPEEAPTEPLLIDEHRYPHLRALRADDEIGDGLWLCCHCRHENILHHYKGRFPFKHLTCNRCKRLLCSECQTTEVLSQLPYGMIHVPKPSDSEEVRYLHVCTNCGLSHRAEMEGSTLDFYGVTCAGCGTSSYGDWPRYHIGSVEPYRRDPDASYARLVEQKAERAANLAHHWNENDRAPSRLSCKNSD